MRGVLDTNIIVSALLAPTGTPAAIIKIWLDGEFMLLTCATQVSDLRAKLQKPRVSERIKPHQAGRLASASGSSPKILIPCPEWNALPTQPTISCWPYPKAVRPITS